MISLSFLLEKGYLNLLVVVMALLTIFVPFLCGYDLDVLDSGPALEAILSSEAQTSYAFFLASTIPAVIDTTLDYSNYYNPIKWKKYIFGRMPIVITGFLVSLQFFVITNTTSIFNLTDCKAESYLLSFSSLKIVFTGSMMIILTSIKPTLFTGLRTTMISIFVCSFIVIRTFTPGSSTTYHDFSTILNYIFLGSSVITLIYFLYQLTITSHIMAVSLIWQIILVYYICLYTLLVLLVRLPTHFGLGQQGNES